jgi:hypothetical protein
VKGWVYFVFATESERIKIGYTQGPPEGRLQTLQTGSPEVLEYLGAIPGTLALEAELHRRFAASRVCGEWFQRTAELVAFIFDCLHPGARA